MALVLVTGAISAAAVVNRRAPSDSTVRADGGNVTAAGMARAGTRPAGADAGATTTTRDGRPPESTATTRVPATTVTTAVPGVTSTSTTAARTGTSDPLIVSIPFSAGRTSWTGVSSGVTITVKVDKANPRTGEPVQFDVEASSASRACCVIVVSFGDGSMYGHQNETGPCAPGAPHGHGPATASTGHTYGRDNQYMFEVRALTGNCEEPGVAAALFGEIQVGPVIQPGLWAPSWPGAPVILGHRVERPADWCRPRLLPISTGQVGL